MRDGREQESKGDKNRVEAERARPAKENSGKQEREGGRRGGSEGEERWRWGRRER